MILARLNRHRRRPALSVIVPIYGVEEWLDAFLLSLTTQTFQDWECLMILDGVSDESPAVARRWARRDTRLHTFAIRNRGLGGARNYGLKRARGEFITFPDPDDILPAGAYAAAVGSLNPNVDFVTGPADDLRPDGARVRYWTTSDPVFDRGSPTVTLNEEPSLIGDHTVWNKVFRRSFLNAHGIRFPEGTLCEDVVPSARAYIAARSVAVVPDLVYVHRRRAGAITTDLQSRRALDDWMEQSRQARLIVESGPQEILTPYLDRFLRLEAWTRVRGLEKLDDEVSADFATFIRELLESTPAEVIDFLPLVKRLMYRAVADGLLSTLSTERRGSLFASSGMPVGAIAREIALLERHGPLGALRDALIDTQIVRPALNERPADDNDASKLAAALLTLWPTAPSPHELSHSSLPTATIATLHAAAEAGDRQSFLAAWNGSTMRSAPRSGP